MARSIAARVRRLGVCLAGGGLLLLAAPSAVAEPAAVSARPLAATPATADLAIAVSGPSTAAPGSKVTYVVTVTNNGPDGSPASTVVDLIPAGFTAVATSTPGCSVTGRLVTCTQGALALHGTSVITITAIVPGGFSTPATNRAAVVGRILDLPAGNNLATQVVNPAPKGQLFELPVALATLGVAGAVAMAVGAIRRRTRRPSVEV
jgi:uncharacterized repeat protein (TIGR01451 family)